MTWLLPALAGLGGLFGAGGIQPRQTDWSFLQQGYKVPQAPQYQIPQYQTGIEKGLYGALLPRMAGEGVGLPVQDIMGQYKTVYQQQFQEAMDEVRNRAAREGWFHTGQRALEEGKFAQTYASQLAQTQAGLMQQSEQMRQSAIEQALSQGLGYGQYLGGEARAYQEPQMQQWKYQVQAKQQQFAGQLQKALAEMGFNQQQAGKLSDVLMTFTSSFLGGLIPKPA